METSDFNLIDDYLLGRLEGKALADFENRRNTDADFARAIAEQTKSIGLLQKMGDLEMKLEVQEVQAQFSAARKPKSVIRTLRPWLVAASVFLLLGVSFWMLQGSTNDRLFDAYYSAYDTGFGARDGEKEQKEKLLEASIFYQQQQYEKALPILESITTVKDGKLRLMQGICQLELGDYDKAIQSFDQLVVDKDPAFQYHGRWYAAMAYLKAGEVDKCKVQLQHLVTSQDSMGVYQQEAAKEVLLKIK